MGSKIIAISRQYGSGGRQIGQILSDKLGIPFLDKEIIDRAARESGIDRKHMSGVDQNGAGSPIYTVVPGTHFQLPINDRLYFAQCEAMRRLAGEGPCVIVGHGACRILRDEFPMLGVFIGADFEVRRRRVLEEYGESPENIEKRICGIDKKRMAYYTFYEGKKELWTQHFDLCIDSGRLGIDKTVKVILAAYEM